MEISSYLGRVPACFQAINLARIGSACCALHRLFLDNSPSPVQGTEGDDLASPIGPVSYSAAALVVDLVTTSGVRKCPISSTLSARSPRKCICCAVFQTRTLLDLVAISSKNFKPSCHLSLRVLKIGQPMQCSMVGSDCKLPATQVMSVVLCEVQDS